jgi:predicted small secreted protein
LGGRSGTGVTACAGGNPFTGAAIGGVGDTATGPDDVDPGAVRSETDTRPSDVDQADQHGRTTTMRKTFSITLTLLMLIGAVPLLGACHTMAGAGQDISSTGNALTNSADKHSP